MVLVWERHTQKSFDPSHSRVLDLTMFRILVLKAVGRQVFLNPTIRLRMSHNLESLIRRRNRCKLEFWRLLTKLVFCCLHHTLFDFHHRHTLSDFRRKDLMCVNRHSPKLVYVRRHRLFSSQESFHQYLVQVLKYVSSTIR